MTQSLPTLDERAVASATPGADPRMSSDAPMVPLRALDQLWFQVAGTVCNLRCRHCFISCSPDNHAFWFMSRGQVAEALEASMRLGVKEYYFTGGEPFMNADILGILEDTLALGPATVLTNATLLPQRTVDALRALGEASLYTLELRVSIDGVTADMNDAIRGQGSFERALEAVGRLADAGFLPIITTMQSWEDHETDAILASFREILAGVGYEQARLKILPPLRIGAEAERSRGYEDVERVTSAMMRDYPAELLLCSDARLVTARGVWVCPILLDEPAARAGDTLEEAVAAPARLRSQACYTCWVNGAVCSNLPGFGDHHT